MGEMIFPAVFQQFNGFKDFSQCIHMFFHFSLIEFMTNLFKPNTEFILHFFLRFIHSLIVVIHIIVDQVCFFAD